MGKELVSSVVVALAVREQSGIVSSVTKLRGLQSLKRTHTNYSSD